MKPDTSLEDQLDGALAAILSEGWDEPDTPVPRQDPPASTDIPVQPPDTEYPPLPVPVDEPEAQDEAVPRARPARHVNIGLLTDLATGRKTAVQAAHDAGVTPDQLQSELAVALRQIPPEEIARALGLQAAEQQLKSGALYGAVLADLVGDMVSGRLRAAEKLDLARLLARVGRIEPKEEKGAAVGGGFVLNINMGQGVAPITIEG